MSKDLSKDDSQLENQPLHVPNVSKQAFVGIAIVYFSVFLDTMGMSIIQPILPFYAEKFDADSTQLGAVYSVYAAMSLLATFMMGKMSDLVKSNMPPFHNCGGPQIK